MKKEVLVGKVLIGGEAPISIQSMTNTDTANVEATSKQITELAMAGCDLVRISVYNQDCAKSVKQLVEKSSVPLVADIHFDERLAIASIENGIAKLRLNPGNIQGEEKVAKVADCAKCHHVPIRIGVNSGSVPKSILARDGGVTPQGLVDSAKKHVSILEKRGFDDIVLSIKASDVATMVAANRLADKTFPYPLHLGVTEAGLPGQGTIKSAIGIGSLLLDGIGNTIRVSITGSPLPEAEAALSILRALNLRAGVQIISCPTCGRTQVDVSAIAKEVEEKTKHLKISMVVAIMGCVVNGPGEAQGADIAFCGGKDSGALYVGGKFVKKLTENYTGEILVQIEQIMEERDGKTQTNI